MSERNRDCSILEWGAPPPATAREQALAGIARARARADARERDDRHSLVRFALLALVLLGAVYLLLAPQAAELAAARDRASFHVRLWSEGHQYPADRCYATDVERRGDRLRIRSARTGRWYDWPAARCTVEELDR